MNTTNDVHEAARIVAAGGIIAYPTEAVFGLGCDPGNTASVVRLLETKQRAQDKGLILVASEQDQLTPYISSLTADQQRRLDSHWPGPVTFIVSAARGISQELTGGRDTIAVRVSSHPQLVDLCNACGSALVSTSANRSGQPPIRSSEAWISSTNQNDQQLLDDIDLLLLGDVGRRDKPSDIIDLQSGEMLR